MDNYYYYYFTWIIYILYACESLCACLLLYLGLMSQVADNFITVVLVSSSFYVFG